MQQTLQRIALKTAFANASAGQLDSSSPLFYPRYKPEQNRQIQGQSWGNSAK